MTDELNPREVAQRLGTTTRSVQRWIATGKLPARRVGRPEDIAQAILFVATNPFATGTTVTVDGGGTIA